MRCFATDSRLEASPAAMKTMRALCVFRCGRKCGAQGLPIGARGSTPERAICAACQVILCEDPCRDRDVRCRTAS